VTSELVTNAVMHGLTPTTVSIDISARAITISVSDLGDAQVRPRHASLTDEGGRGLQIVGELASDWHVVRLNGGKTVIANLPLPAPDGAP
jgi:anti-sigma regulatory factor (Ser/Thr protein kinase)